jgi:hypothetical protein
MTHTHVTTIFLDIGKVLLTNGLGFSVWRFFAAFGGSE